MYCQDLSMLRLFWGLLTKKIQARGLMHSHVIVQASHIIVTLGGWKARLMAHARTCNLWWDYVRACWEAAKTKKELCCLPPPLWHWEVGMWQSTKLQQIPALGWVEGAGPSAMAETMPSCSFWAEKHMKLEGVLLPISFLFRSGLGWPGHYPSNETHTVIILLQFGWLLCERLAQWMQVRGALGLSLSLSSIIVAMSWPLSSWELPVCFVCVFVWVAKKIQSWLWL